MNALTTIHKHVTATIAGPVTFWLMGLRTSRRILGQHSLGRFERQHEGVSRKLKGGVGGSELCTNSPWSSSVPSFHSILTAFLALLKEVSCWWSSGLSFTNQILILYANSLRMKMAILLGQPHVIKCTKTSQISRSPIP